MVKKCIKLVFYIYFSLCFIVEVLILKEFQAIVVFLITIHAYASEKSEIEEVSMVALSGCIWLQAFVVAIETK